jgi:hypothetical protein
MFFRSSGLYVSVRCDALNLVGPESQVSSSIIKYLQSFVSKGDQTKPIHDFHSTKLVLHVSSPPFKQPSIDFGPSWAQLQVLIMLRLISCFHNQTCGMFKWMNSLSISRTAFLCQLSTFFETNTFCIRSQDMQDSEPSHQDIRDASTSG